MTEFQQQIVLTIAPYAGLALGTVVALGTIWACQRIAAWWRGFRDDDIAIGLYDLRGGRAIWRRTDRLSRHDLDAAVAELEMRTATDALGKESPVAASDAPPTRVPTKHPHHNASTVQNQAAPASDGERTPP